MVFGVKTINVHVTIEQIRMSSNTNDRTFFEELWTKYVENTWSLQRWLSPFRFRHCRVVEASPKLTPYRYQV